MEHPCCENCVFCDKSYTNLRRCRKNPPVFILSFQRWMWPEVNKGDWCGEFTMQKQKDCELQSKPQHILVDSEDVDGFSEAWRNAKKPVRKQKDGEA